MSDLLLEKFENALTNLEQASDFAKPRYQSQVLNLAGRMLTKENGIELLSKAAPRFDKGGLFLGTDWDEPANLIPALVPNTLENGAPDSVVLDCLSQLRILSLAQGDTVHDAFDAQAARKFLSQVLAVNLKLVFGNLDESMRARLGALAEAVPVLYRFMLNELGYESILTELIDEIWRLMAQRPIQVAPIKAMVTQVSLVLQEEGDFGEVRLGADRLVSALFSPTQQCIDDPGLDVYQERLAAMDKQALQQEAYGFSRAMHDVGLVSDYHVVLLRFLLGNKREELVSDALGLSSTGIDILSTYQHLVYTLIQEAIFPPTAQAIYGLSQMLESGVLHAPPVAPSLWRQLGLKLSEQSENVLASVFGEQLPARVYLLSGVISLLGQPLGVSQGNHPTCQSARALSMWASNDPDYLLNIIAYVSKHDELIMHFEGTRIYSSQLPAGSMGEVVPMDTDPVSVLLVPHLDRIYAEMGRMCINRGEDPHQWVNPEFHGWWVGRHFHIAVDVSTGKLKNYDDFARQFFLNYHPIYNGNQPVIHPQPVGLAVTDSNGNSVGWHAVTLIRVALDQENVTRCYFYNPNSDSGQNWGNQVIVSSQGFGERHGEASLPFEQFLSRLYIFHTDALVESGGVEVPEKLIEMTREMATRSWAKDKLPPSLVAEP